MALAIEMSRKLKAKYVILIRKFAVYQYTKHSSRFRIKKFLGQYIITILRTVVAY